jgi:hypothetical protein
MSRGRPKEIVQEPQPLKFERRYEDDECTEVWKYDLNKWDKGPISIEITYKPGVVKNWGNKLKETKAAKKIARQMKKIKNKQNGTKTSKSRRVRE